MQVNFTTKIGPFALADGPISFRDLFHSPFFGLDELLMLMSAMTKDDRFEETINELSRKESVTMCEVLDKVEARGRKEGVIIVLISLVKDGILSISEAAKRADMSEESFKEYLES